METVLSLHLIFYFICSSSLSIPLDMPNMTGLTIYQLRGIWKDLSQLLPCTTSGVELPSNNSDEPVTNTLVWPKYPVLHLLHPSLFLAHCFLEPPHSFGTSFAFGLILFAQQCHKGHKQYIKITIHTCVFLMHPQYHRSVYIQTLCQYRCGSLKTVLIF